MKKKLTLLAALVLSIGMFSACGNNADKKEEAPKEETKVEEKAEEKTEEKEEGKEETEPAKEGQTEIVFWHAMGGGQGEALEAIVADF